MKTFKNCAAQGDVLITRIQSLPENAVKVQRTSDTYVVAHSETGHHHVLDSNKVDFYHAMNDDSVNEFVSYLKVNEDVELRHLRGFDTHESISIGEGLYRLNHQREYTPEGFRKAAD